MDHWTRFFIIIITFLSLLICAILIFFLGQVQRVLNFLSWTRFSKRLEIPFPVFKNNTVSFSFLLITNSNQKHKIRWSMFIQHCTSARDSDTIRKRPASSLVNHFIHSLLTLVSIVSQLDQLQRLKWACRFGCGKTWLALLAKLVLHSSWYNFNSNK